MRRLHIVFAACAAMFALGSCASYTPHDHMHENYYRRKLPDKLIRPMGQWCQGLRCNRSMHFNDNCESLDDDSRSLTNIDANIGTHICFYNDSSCDLVLKFGGVLFGPSHSTITIKAHQCAAMIVTREAAGRTFSIESICTCKEGGPHTNPTVKVGNDEDP